MATLAVGPHHARRRGRTEEEEDAPDEAGEAKLTELLTETRILLPGTEVFLGFLATMPFSQHFPDLDGPRRVVYICTFFSTLLALICFVVPAAYHRIARPIRHKDRFKSLANKFLVAGLVPMSVAMVLASYLVSYVVLDGAALYLSGVIAILILAVWWVVPLARMHHLLAPRRQAERPRR